ncbi:MAG: hypothetical protein DMG38_00540 [Acidobacteria bacterium]|nr:MAG: hypothetical protein DMG38_00540 [Acidobacteriota bacterium]
MKTYRRLFRMRSTAGLPESAGSAALQSHTRTRAALIPPIPPIRIVRDESLRCGMMSLPVSPTEATQKEMQIMRKKFLRGTLAPLLLITGTAVPLLTGAAAVSAQEVTQAEKERALQYLESTKKNLTEATKGLSEAQWNFKPASDRWSVAQVMEHLAAAEDFIRGITKEKVMTSSAGEPGRDFKKTDEAVLMMVPDRTHKAQAPEPLVPTNRFGSPDGSLKHFVESRLATEDFLKSTAGLRDHVMDSPLGKLDGYEFVLFIAAHSERHTKQINEVKADPNFPKN